MAVFGTRNDDAADALHRAAAPHALEVRWFDRADDTLRCVYRDAPLALVVQIAAAGAFDVVSAVRAEPRLRPLPVLGAARAPCDADFGRIYELGGDDVIATYSTSSLERRFRALRREPPPRARAAPVSRALLVSTSDRWRSSMARVLANVGIDAECVSGPNDALRAIASSRYRVIVTTDDVEPTRAVDLARSARDRGCDAPWIIATRRRQPNDRMIEACEEIPRLAFLDVFGPPENVLFVANALASPRVVDQRASRRLLLGTPVAFRVAGDREDDVGYSYEISAEGMFVRTLAPLEPDERAWLEVVPPGRTRAVRLLARVVWRRTFGPIDDATVPPGFGAEIIGGLPGDAARWEDAYRALERPRDESAVASTAAVAKHA